MREDFVYYRGYILNLKRGKKVLKLISFGSYRGCYYKLNLSTLNPTTNSPIQTEVSEDTIELIQEFLEELFETD